MFGGRRTAGDLVGVWQGSAIYLSTDTLLVKGGLEEPRVAVKFHQVEDLWLRRTKVLGGEKDMVCESDMRRHEETHRSKIKKMGYEKDKEERRNY